MDELRFQLENLDHGAEHIESFLATHLYSLHARRHATDAPTTSESIFSPTIQTFFMKDMETHP
jgi:hypothetical protein